VAERHPGAEGQIVIYVPRSYQIQSASSAYHGEGPPTEAQIVYLPLKFTEKETPWSVTFAPRQ